MRLAIVLLVIALITGGCLAEGYIGSRDFGSDDAELLMRIAQAELGSAPAHEKADLMIEILVRVWDLENPCSIEEAIETGGFQSVASGAYYSAVPDAASELAVKMVYMGWPDAGLIAALKITNVLEWLLPFLTISFSIMFLGLAAVGLEQWQVKLARKINNRR